jgi:hypothetical protein
MQADMQKLSKMIKHVEKDRKRQQLEVHPRLCLQLAASLYANGLAVRRHSGLSCATRHRPLAAATLETTEPSEPSEPSDLEVSSLMVRLEKK